MGGRGVDVYCFVYCMLYVRIDFLLRMWGCATWGILLGCVCGCGDAGKGGCI